MQKVLLLSMPFGALERPALGLSLLKAQIERENVACDIRYLNVTFAEFIGVDTYQWLGYDLPYTAFAGDWTFTEALYGSRTQADAAYTQQILRENWQLREDDIAHLASVRACVSTFLDHCMTAIPWQEYAIVGFTSTFEQNIASLALARRIKQCYPQITTVFGGANWEQEMGQELHRQFAFVDYVCSGEAEQSFASLVNALMQKPRGDVAAIKGIVYRCADGQTAATGQAALKMNLDTLPIPDYSDYFQALEQSHIRSAVAPMLLIETSRGCWWGAKSHCTFCGLNGGAMAFRCKTPERALHELEYLTHTWQIDTVEAVDNILDMRYFKTVLPALARAQRPLSLFYEVKANLTRKHLQLLLQAGVRRIQPGIESMSDHVLQLMRKGTTALRNIQMLKWCQEYGIEADWNLLYGFPGETREDYAQTLTLLQAIRFFKPPSACGPVRLDRFSPYFESAGEFGLHNLRPIAPYAYLYPFELESLARIAYYFDFDYAPERDPTGFAQPVIEYVSEWKRCPEMGGLFAQKQPDGSLYLYDSRADAGIPFLRLDALDQRAYELCDEMQTLENICGGLHEFSPGGHFSEEQVRGLLESLIANRLMVTDGVHYLSLALYSPPRQVETHAASPLSVLAGVN